MDMAAYKEDFLSDAKRILGELDGALSLLRVSPEDREALLCLFRAFHTLKGNARMMGYTKLSRLAAACEEAAGRAQSAESLSSGCLDSLCEGGRQLRAGILAIEEGAEFSFDVDSFINSLGRANCKL